MSKNLRKRTLAPMRTGILAAIGLAACSCSDNQDFSRSQTLLVFDDPVEQSASEHIVCRVDGGIDTIWVRSNVDFSMDFRTADENSSWVRFEQMGYDDKRDARMFRVIYDPSQDGTFVKRTGTLSLVNPEIYLGQFVVFTQGFDTRLTETFDWLKTGSDIPYDPTGEKLYSSWTNAQKEIGWTSPAVGNNEEAYLYAKKGYVKMGDGVHASQLVTPDLAKMVADSIVLVSFKALAYVGQTGEKDGSELVLSIENGGRFPDGSKTRTFQASYYDPVDPQLVDNMWKEATLTTFVVTDDTEAFTDKTALRFSTPDGANRIFLDDIYIYIIDDESLYMLGEKQPRHHPKTQIP